MNCFKFIFFLTSLFLTSCSIAEVAPDVVAENILKFCKGQRACKLEANAIKNAAGRVVHKDDVLRITTKSKTFTFKTDEEAAKTPVSYKYLGFYEKFGAHLILRVSDFEDFEYLFLSGKNDQITMMPNIPHPSPNNKYLVSLVSNEASGPANQIVLWESVDGILLQRFKFLPRVYALFDFKQWSSEIDLSFITTTWSDSGYPHGLRCKFTTMLEVPQKLLQRNGEWKIENDFKTQSPQCASK